MVAGDPELSGCYCEHCMAKFTTVLEGMNASTRERLNVSVSPQAIRRCWWFLAQFGRIVCASRRHSTTETFCWTTAATLYLLRVIY